MVEVWARSSQWSLLRWSMEERRAFSGGERIEVGDEWSAVRSGEGWPERERRISWSIVDQVCVLSIHNSKTCLCTYWEGGPFGALNLSRRS